MEIASCSCDRSIGADGLRIDRAAMEDVENASMEQMKKMMNYPLIKNCDMTEEMRQDCSDLVITAVEKHANNFEAAARLVKEAMDKKYNESWVVIIGEGFGFEVTHEVGRCRRPAALAVITRSTQSCLISSFMSQFCGRMQRWRVSRVLGRRRRPRRARAGAP